MNESKKFYEKWGGERYEKSFFPSWFEKKHQRLVTNITFQNNQPSVLDVGSGPGQLLKKIKEKFPNAQLAALDISSAMITRVRERLPRVDAKVGNAEILPWTNNTFDIVTNSISFHHYHNPLSALREACRVLKPEGKFYLMDVNPDSSFIRSFYNLFGIIARDGHVTFYTKNEMRHMFQEAGFVNVHQVLAGFLWRITITIGEKA